MLRIRHVLIFLQQLMDVTGLKDDNFRCYCCSYTRWQKL